MDARQAGSDFRRYLSDFDADTRIHDRLGVTRVLAVTTTHICTYLILT